MPHAPGHLREAFAIWVEDGFPSEIDLDEYGEHIFSDGKPRSARWLIGKLWHCSDIMPSDLCDELDVPKGSSYARAVQLIAKDRVPVA